MITLQPFSAEDIPQLIEWATSPEFLLQWTGPVYRFPLDEAQVRENLARAAGDDPALLPFKVVLDQDSRMIGYIELTGINGRMQSATVGRVIVGPEELRGKGIGLRMMREIVRIGFQEVGLHRIALHVFDFNAAAIRCYEKAGFQIEGRLRDAVPMGSAYWSLYLMSILETEWPEPKK